MLAKVIAYAPTRTEAAGRLALALERCHIGGVITNRDFLVATLRTPEFLAGDTTTDFIERVDPPRSLEFTDAELEILAGTAALWIQGENRSEAQVLGAAPSGWRNTRLPDQRVSFTHDKREVAISYRALRDGSFRMGDGAVARIHAWSDRGIDLEIDGRRRQTRITRAGARLFVQSSRGDLELVEQPRFEAPESTAPSGVLVAPMPGKVIDLRVAVGDSVRTGEILVVLEAMKMEHPLSAAAYGVVSEVLVSAGDQVENGALLLVVTSASADSAATRKS